VKYLALALLASACTTFDPIERDVCGNGLVERGEDCDSSDSTCVACAVTCATAADCPNAAYACGVDGVCHAPSGLLAPATAPSLDLVDEIRITDLDGDGIGDVLGVSKTSIEVRYGDAHAELATAATVITPPQTAPVAFGDLDGDGRLDTSIATQDGIVSFTSPYGAPSPAVSLLPLQNDGQVLSVLATFSITDLAIGAVVEDPTSGTLVLDVIEFTGGATTGLTSGLCALPAAEFSPSDFDVYAIPQNSDGSIDLVFSVLTHGATHHLCASAVHLDPPATDLSRAAHFYDITPTVTAPAIKPIWADLDLDTDPCPSLVDSDGGGNALKAWDGSLKAGLGQHCQLAATTESLPVATGAGDAAYAIGRIPFTPGFIGTANDVLVMTTGLYLFYYDVTSASDQLTEVYRSERKLDGVATGDLDGDGAIDAVLSSNDGADVDVVYRADQGIVPGYIALRLDTDAPVSQMLIADFDGNGLGDLAYTEQLLDHQELSVAFSEPGHNFTDLPQGAFNSIQTLARLDVADSSDPESVIADMIVLENLGAGLPAITLLHGNPQRTMLSYFEPRIAGDPNRGAAMRQVVVGNFASSPTDLQYPDLVALLPAADGGSSPVTAYRLDGTSAGLDATDAIDDAFGEHIATLEDCTAGAPSNGTPCIRDARLLPWSTATAHDVVIGIDHQVPPQAFRLDPWAFTASGTTAGTTSATVVAAPTIGVPASAQVHTAFALDLDGDGAPELVVAFAPTETDSASGPGLVEACTMAADGTPTTCVDLSTAVAAVAPNTSCVDAAPGHFTPGGFDIPPPTGNALVVLCHDATGVSVLANVAWSGSAYTATLVASGLPALRQIAVGDVTGDGLDDVVAIRGDAGARSITVLAQCSSRDLTCQATAVAP
jgi:hypothetical protein